MTIKNQFQLDNTRAKLRLLEDQYASLRSQPAENAYTRELTLRAFQSWIKRLKEEILRYECRAKASATQE